MNDKDVTVKNSEGTKVIRVEIRNKNLRSTLKKVSETDSSSLSKEEQESRDKALQKKQQYTKKYHYEKVQSNITKQQDSTKTNNYLKANNFRNTSNTNFGNSSVRSTSFTNQRFSKDLSKNLNTSLYQNRTRRPASQVVLKNAYASPRPTMYPKRVMQSTDTAKPFFKKRPLNRPFKPAFGANKFGNYTNNRPINNKFTSTGSGSVRQGPYQRPILPRKPSIFTSFVPHSQTKPTKRISQKATSSNKKSARTSIRIEEEKPQAFSRQFLGQIQSAEDVLQEDRVRSLSAVQRAKEKKRRKTTVIRDVKVHEGISVRDLANRMAITTSILIKKLLQCGIKASIDTEIEENTALLMVEELGHKGHATKNALSSLEADKGVDEDYQLRAPVVSIVGHVDHGKTSLLDALRKTNVVSKEAGGITQSIGASQIFRNDGKFITFIDTPGHQAFTLMRARGIQVTDIVILVVAADDGIKEQTIESIQHAQAAQSTIIVAITKIDKNAKNTENIKHALVQHNIIADDLGGDVMFVEVSAHTGKNLDVLMDTILLQAELLDLKANTKCKASGYIIESYMDKHRGPIATVLIKNGTLKIGDVFVSESTYGKVKRLINFRNETLKSAEPSTPAIIIGFNEVPKVGVELIVVDDEKNAKTISQQSIDLGRKISSTDLSTNIDLSNIFEETDQPTNIIIKSSSSGSLEALESSILKLSTDDTELKIIGKSVGAVTESDIALAITSNAIVVAFEVALSSSVQKEAQSNNIHVIRDGVIYSILEKLKSYIIELKPQKAEIQTLGQASVRELFQRPKIGVVAGCMVTEGIISSKGKIRVIRNGIEIRTEEIKSLRQYREDVREVKTNQECGIMLENFNDFHVNDILECVSE